MKAMPAALPAGTRASAPKALRVLILGAGAVTRIFYVPAFSKGLNGLVLAAVVDRSKAALQQLGQLPGSVRLCATSVDEALRDPGVIESVDLAIVALPHALHESAVTLALKAGLHVFSEKPLGLSESEVRRMAEAARAYGRLLGVCQPRRSLPAVRAIGQMLAAGTLGRVQRVVWSEGQPYAWPAQSLAQVSLAQGGSELHDIGAHAFDVLCQWFGPLDVTGYRDDSLGGTPAEFQVQLASAHIGAVEVELSRLRHLRNTVVVEGTQGRITWSLSKPDAFELEATQILGLQDVEIRVSTAGQPTSVYEAVQAQLESFGRAAAGLAPLDGSAESALGYARIFDQCAVQMGAGVPSATVSTEAAEFIVIGAAGFIGCTLVQALLRDGKRVKALVHRPASAVRLMRHDVQVALCDVAQPDTYRQHITPGCVVINCAVSHAGEELERVVVDGALALLNTAAEQRARRVVLLSSMLAYGDPPSQGEVSEATGESPTLVAYARAKAEMERQCLKWASRSSTELVILQPTCVYGPYAKDFGTAPLDDMRTGGFFLHGGGRGRANLVFVENLVDAILLAALKPVRSGSRYLLNEDAESGTWADFYGCLSTAAFGQPLSGYPSIELTELADLCAAWRREHNFPMVLRAAVRASPAAVDWLSGQRWFQAWRTLRGGHRPAQPQAPAQVRALTANELTPQQQAELALRQRLLGQRRLFVNESSGRFFTSQAVYSSALIRNELGWVPRVPRIEALRLTAQWAANAYEHRAPLSSTSA